MFDHMYLIQGAAVMIVFLTWFLFSLPHNYYQFVGGDVPADPEAFDPKTEFEYRSINNHRQLLDGLMLLAIGIIFNILGMGYKTAADVLSLIIAFSLFFLAIFNVLGFMRIARIFWILQSLATLGLFIVPFATRTWFNWW
ncbi:hypothetical protein CONCODRAFT_3101 [Conidiobolus coronatus NRRL 28638]|jgi:hypothetical protein|uniref:Uncharacterized protein n=1 Tax=Conidiobolus coronatus (strain ATCC 28846 / CBS 209.66 / NRRL 28638) TaxID=796925 RepID=A0A137PFU8_CONC2|nr:hypothetical protein CONCODRAFT_3101 [Conidiobolus coronatus NRRL 28638]|eukprot:KXN73862.1 hypothetical protein CONCODRAFT_3101 [Conidiobolus coronatus NRRL 28638]